MKDLAEPEREYRHRVLRYPDVARIVRVSRTTIYRWVKKGRFPAPRYFGPSVRGWLWEDVEAWLTTRPTEDPTTGIGA